MPSPVAPDDYLHVLYSVVIYQFQGFEELSTFGFASFRSIFKEHKAQNLQYVDIHLEQDN